MPRQKRPRSAKLESALPPGPAAASEGQQAGFGSLPGPLLELVVSKLVASAESDLLTVATRCIWCGRHQRLSCDCCHTLVDPPFERLVIRAEYLDDTKGGWLPHFMHPDANLTADTILFRTAMLSAITTCRRVCRHWRDSVGWAAVDVLRLDNVEDAVEPYAGPTAIGQRVGGAKPLVLPHNFALRFLHTETLDLSSVCFSQSPPPNTSQDRCHPL